MQDNSTFSSTLGRMTCYKTKQTYKIIDAYSLRCFNTTAMDPTVSDNRLRRVPSMTPIDRPPNLRDLRQLSYLSPFPRSASVEPCLLTAERGRGEPGVSKGLDCSYHGLETMGLKGLDGEQSRLQQHTPTHCAPAVEPRAICVRTSVQP